MKKQHKPFPVLLAGLFCATMVFNLTVVIGYNQISYAQTSNFQGGSPDVIQTPEVNRVRIRFPAGVRSSWHSHTDGQLLMIEEGIGLTQVRGRLIEEKHPGEPWWTAAGVEHWHGAHPEVDALQLTVYEGSAIWMDPVTDEQYGGLRMAR